MTKAAFIETAIAEAKARYPWASDVDRLAKYQAALDAACTGGAGRVALDGPAVIAAWQAIGGKGKPTYKALEALAA